MLNVPASLFCFADVASWHNSDMADPGAMSVISGQANLLGSISYSWTGLSQFRGLSFLLIPHDDQAILRQYQQSLSFWRAPSADAVRFRSIL